MNTAANLPADTTVDVKRMKIEVDSGGTAAVAGPSPHTQQMIDVMKNEAH